MSQNPKERGYNRGRGTSSEGEGDIDPHCCRNWGGGECSPRGRRPKSPPSSSAVCYFKKNPTGAHSIELREGIYNPLLSTANTREMRARTRYEAPATSTEQFSKENTSSGPVGVGGVGGVVAREQRN